MSVWFLYCFIEFALLFIFDDFLFIFFSRLSSRASSYSEDKSEMIEEEENMRE